MKPKIAPYKYEAKRKIDFACGHKRSEFLTVVHGQQSVYDYKLEDANNFMNGADIESCIYLKSEAELNNITYLDQAKIYIDKDLQCKLKLKDIEFLRLKYKKLVDEKMTEADIDFCLNTFFNLLRDV